MATLIHGAQGTSVGSTQLNYYSNGVPKLRQFASPKNLHYEIFRLATFATWPLKHIDPKDLAATGFFYIMKEDYVQCAFCQGVVGYWDHDDIPSIEHKKHYPHCSMFKPICGNIPIAASDTTDGKSDPFTLIQDYLLYRISHTKIPKPKYGMVQIDARNVSNGDDIDSASTVAYPVFATVNSRFHSFNQRFPEVKISPAKFAEAGFFYTGISDLVSCYHCGGGLFNWASPDASNDPWEDHAKYYSHCPFVTSIKGSSYVQETQRNLLPLTKERKLKISKNESKIIIEHPVIQSLKNMGIKEEKLEKAFKRSLEDHCHFPGTTSEAFELFSDYENSDHRMESDDDEEQSESEPSSDEDDPVKQVEKLRMDCRQIGENLEKEKHRISCKACKVNKSDIVLMPCRHFSSCSSCYSGLNNCPVCHVGLRGFLQPLRV